MTKLEHQKTANAKDIEALENLESMQTISGDASDFSDSPALVALEAKLLRRRRHEAPHTYRRPAYLRYIEYA